MRDERRHAVVAQAAGVESGRHERRAEGVHLGERRHVAGVAEVVGIAPPGQARTGRRLDRHDAHRLAAAQLRADERERDAGEVRAAAGAADDDVRIVVGHLELRHRFLADDRLMQQHMIQHRAEGVFGVVVSRGDFDRLGDGDAETAVAVGRGCQHLPAEIGLRSRDSAHSGRQRSP